MKKDIHPKYTVESSIICACGSVVKAGSTMERMTTDICSKCHPFFTGKANIVDTDKAEKFKAKFAAANLNYAKEKKAKEAAKKAAKQSKGIKVEESK